MGKLSVNNLGVSNSESVCLPPPTKQEINNGSISYSSNKDLMIFHQNIRGLEDKTDEIVNIIETNPPCVLCFTEHHLSSYQLDVIILLNYKLGASFCREVYKNGGVCIYIHESLQFSIIDVLKFCKEKDLEVCFVKVYLPECTIGIINLYRSPSGNFE